jgi:hypothetical protein
MGNNWSAYVSLGSAVVAVVAAVYAANQARAAKRQADAAHGDVQPTFHTELHEDNGRPPWGFRLKVRNFNRRPLKIKRARIRIPDGLLIWESDDTDPDTIRAILEAAARSQGEASFEIEQILDGVSPNAGAPTNYEHDFHAGFRTGTSETRRILCVNLIIEWEYAAGKISPQTEAMTVDLPMGRA